MSEQRQIIVVDVESNGLDLERHQAVEVAWWNLDTGERDCFVPQHNVSHVLRDASIKALQVNRYVDRLAEAQQDDGTAVRRLWSQFDGGNVVDDERPPAAILLGSNPRFDAAMIRKMRPAWAEPWHYRLWDIAAYAAGVLGMTERLPGLWDICETLGVPFGDHSAEGDVTATGLCFRELQRIVRDRGAAA